MVAGSDAPRGDRLTPMAAPRIRMATGSKMGARDRPRRVLVIKTQGCRYKELATDGHGYTQIKTKTVKRQSVFIGVHLWLYLRLGK
jgi:hypothetical protein